MDNSTAFGSYGNIDILNSNTYCNSSGIDGEWYIALTGDGTDAISLNLDTNLDSGAVYTINFFDRFCNPFNSYTPEPIIIGLSTSDTVFGDLIFITQSLPTNTWNLRTFSFTAPNNGEFITAKVFGGNLGGTWIQLDGFSFNEPTITHEIVSETFNIYPNPAKNLIYFENFKSLQSLKIYDLNGKIVFFQEYVERKVNIERLKNGIYVMEVKNIDNQILINKLIVHSE